MNFTSIATLLTGAAGAGGFKGLGGQYGRRNLLSFGVQGVAGIRLTRRDTGATVDCVVRLHKIASDPRRRADRPRGCDRADRAG